MDFFHTAKTDEQDQVRIQACLDTIVAAVSERRSIPEFLRCDDRSVAFAGSEDDMELLLELCIQKYDGRKHLYASLDDMVSWSEWNFTDQAAFENDIIEYLSNRVNRTVKTVVEKVKHARYREAAYYLDEPTGQWVLFEDDFTEDQQFCRIIANCTKTTERIKTYKLDLR